MADRKKDGERKRFNDGKEKQRKLARTRYCLSKGNPYRTVRRGYDDQKYFNNDCKLGKRLRAATKIKLAQHIKNGNVEEFTLPIMEKNSMAYWDTSNHRKPKIFNK